MHTHSVPSRSGWLILEVGTRGERRIPLGKDRIFIGTDPGVQVSVVDPHVSAHHAEVIRSNSGFVITDLGSRNGTQVDGVTVQSAVLEPGATITVGTTTIRFEVAVGFSDQPTAIEGDATHFGRAIGEAPKMRALFSVLQRIAPTDLSICVLGETGVGKEVIAQAIHEGSRRKSKPFVVLDCGAVAANLVESQLFGHVRGAFTGAVSDRAGVFEQADGGTVFLDEIGELPIELQPKLLRILETGVVTRVGSADGLQVDVRVIAATHRKLEEEIRNGGFREDLWFRLSAAVVAVPPLRERRQDLPALIRLFIEEAQPGMRVSEDAMGILQNHNWPGNVRELRNVIQGAAVVCEGDELEPRDFILFRGRARRAPTVESLPLAGKSLEDIERSAIRQSLDHFDGNKTRAAEALGIAPSTLYAKIKKYSI